MHLHKSWLVIVAAFILFSSQIFAQDAQEEAIKKAVIAQEDAFKNRDVEAWKSSWVQDDKASSTLTNIFESRTRVGWNNISERTVKFLQENPMPDSLSIERDSFMIRREGNMAVVDYKQYITFTGGQPPLDKATTREQRVMLKKNGKWLVAAATSTDITVFGNYGTELSLNATGYKFLYDGKNDEAIKVLELNTVLFPDSFNVWDSLGEAYLKAGNKEKAKEYYEKSMTLNPNNESGKKALAELK